MQIPNTISSYRVRNALNSSLVWFIIMFFHYRKQSCSEKVMQVLTNKKPQHSKEAAALWFCLELFKSVCSESMAGCARRLEKLYFTGAVEYFIAAVYVVCKHKCLSPVFYDDTCKQGGENSTRILRWQRAHRYPLFTRLPSSRMTQVPSKESLESCLEPFSSFWKIIPYP